MKEKKLLPPYDMVAYEQMQMAFSVMQESFVPFEAAITEIGLARVNPHSDVVRWELKQQQ